MKLRYCTKPLIVEIICWLYMLLFTYAATSKLLDFENFRIQLGQSPLLSAFAGTVSRLVPVIEIVISFALIFQRTRFLALLGSLTLMVMFTSYIVIILNFSSFVPCSCGGVLEKMGCVINANIKNFYKYGL